MSLFQTRTLVSFNLVVIVLVKKERNASFLMISHNSKKQKKLTFMWIKGSNFLVMYQSKQLRQKLYVIISWMQWNKESMGGIGCVPMEWSVFIGIVYQWDLN